MKYDFKICKIRKQEENVLEKVLQMIEIVEFSFILACAREGMKAQLIFEIAVSSVFFYSRIHDLLCKV